MTPPLVVLTGPIHSGKTTRLAAWLERIGADGTTAGVPVAGILAPVAYGRRRLCSIATGECRDLTASDDLPERRLVTIGPHRFDDAVFAWARGVIGTAASATADARRGSPPRWLVVDEVGPLELRGSGLEPAVSAAIEAALARWRAEPQNTGRRDTAQAPGRLLLVVREGLVERVLEHYDVPHTAVRVVMPGDLQALE